VKLKTNEIVAELKQTRLVWVN